MEEHQEFIARLDVFRRQSRRVAAQPSATSTGAEYIVEFADFLLEDVDRLHGRKEEVGLFPVLGRFIGSDEGPIPVMLEEHEEVRRVHHALVRDAARIASDPEHREALEHVASTGAQVEELLRGHIEKEDTMLFPLAREVIPPEAMLEVVRVCEDIEREARSARVHPR